MKISFIKKHYPGIISVIAMLLIWKLLALYFNSALIVPHPERTLITMLRLFTDVDFLGIAGSTILRGTAGFIISALLGILIGIVSGIRPRFYAFFRPVLVTIRSVPVIALALLALIWFRPGFVPVFIAMLTMFPFICTNVIDGIRKRRPGNCGDGKILQGESQQDHQRGPYSCHYAIYHQRSIERTGYRVEGNYNR